jgi:hypothetical protein
VSSPLTGPDDRDLKRALSLVRFVRDPALPGFLYMIGLILAGFVALLIGWYGTARTIYVPLQVPEVVSGGLGGVGLIGAGVALFDVQQTRRHAARERRQIDAALDEVAELIALAPRIRHRSGEGTGRAGRVRTPAAPGGGQTL